MKVPPRLGRILQWAGFLLLLWMGQLLWLGQLSTANVILGVLLALTVGAVVSELSRWWVTRRGPRPGPGAD